MAETDETIIRIKPHHFLDIIRDLGAGHVWEPHPYGHAVHTVAQELLARRDGLLELVAGADDICRPCKHNIDGSCADTTTSPGYEISKERWNRTIDNRWLDRLGLKLGQIISAREFCRLADERMGDLLTIYPEVEVDRTTERGVNLKKGIAVFLEAGDRRLK
ncbi:DUF1284 domain-containing protein [candidate division KSB1 bacterium]